MFNFIFLLKALNIIFIQIDIEIYEFEIVRESSILAFCSAINLLSSSSQPRRAESSKQP